MCGIVGYIGDKDVDSVILVGLEKLEYRGYDSAGIATISGNELSVRKRVGKLRNLADVLNREPLGGKIGIGHTRWATHGEPNEINAHPQVDCTKQFAVVHNGIIENCYSLKEQLLEEGHVFQSDTDTEVVAHLIEKHYRDSLEKAVLQTADELKGSFALAVISERDPQKIVGVRQNSPLVIGVGKGENLIASDIPALLSLTRKIVDLEDREICVVERDRVGIFTFKGRKVRREARLVDWTVELTEKKGYPHFMLKEIYEQPEVLENNLKRRVKAGNEIDILGDLNLSDSEFSRVSRIFIQACGTSWHAGLIGKYLFEHYCRVYTEVDISSEFRYRNPVADGETYVMAISQSGETADTLGSLREAKAKFLRAISICNVMGSTIPRESDGVVYTHAGPEIGVASTKAYTAQLLTLYLLAFYMAKIRWLLTDKELGEKITELKTIPEKMRRFFDSAQCIDVLAEKFYETRDFLFLGRGINYPSALEGALKLKEVSYIHATGHPAGEMKHGPIALIDEKMPVVCITPKGSVYEKMLSNVEEVKARKGKVIAVATEGDERIRSMADYVVYIPETFEEFTPLLVAPPLQLLAYRIALLRGCDVDKPRNLAKSVTVE